MAWASILTLSGFAAGQDVTVRAAGHHDQVPGWYKFPAFAYQIGEGKPGLVAYGFIQLPLVSERIRTVPTCFSQAEIDSLVVRPKLVALAGMQRLTILWVSRYETRIKQASWWLTLGVGTSWLKRLSRIYPRV